MEFHSGNWKTLNLNHYLRVQCSSMEKQKHKEDQWFTVGSAQQTKKVGVKKLYR